MENSYGSKRVSRSAGLKEIYEVIRTRSPVSRNNLAKMISVSRATMSGIVSELIEAGILEETGAEASTGGRPPVKLSYHPESRLAVGVVQFDTQLRATVTDLEGKPLSTLEMPFYAFNPDSMMRAIVDIVNRALATVPREPVIGVGVGVPGLVDFYSGVLESYASKGWLDVRVKIRDYLQQELNFPAYVINRSRVAALGEHRAGVGKGARDLIYLFIGQGIVAGIILDGKLFFGSRSSAGEIGHVAVVPDGPLCKCGNRGCLEVYANEAAILASARALAKADNGSILYQGLGGRLELMTLDHILQAAQQNDHAAVKVFEEAGSKIGYAVSTLINLFEPEVVILGGPIGSGAGDVLLKPVIKEAQLRTIPRSFANTRIVTGALGTEAATIGAAVLAITQTPIEAVINPKAGSKWRK
jgi:glucokinase-like ROK family protein